MAEGTVGRPRLTALLDEGAQRRLLTVVADAGFGKSTLLSAWAAGRSCAWHTVRAEDASLAGMVARLAEALRSQVPALAAIPAELQSPRGPDADAEQETRAFAYAALLADALAQNLDDDLVLVLDDLHELGPDAPATRLIEGLVRIAPPNVHLIVASRTSMPFGIDRLRGRGQVLEIDATGLRFTVAETLSVLETVLGNGTEELAESLQAAVQGWPAAVRLAVEALRTAPPAERLGRLQRALRSDGPLYDYLAEEVFAAEPPAVRRLVAGVAVLPRFGTDLCQAIGLTSGVETLQQLRTRGLLVSAGDADGYELNPLVKNFANDRLTVDAEELTKLTLDAGQWFESVGEHRDALACYQVVDPARAVRMLTETGHSMVSGGLAEVVVAAVTALPAEHRDQAMDQLEGEARQVLGDWQGAVECFDRIIEPDGEIPVGVAWRLGLIHHLRGQTDVAIATYQRGRIDGAHPTDEALLQAWWAGAHWLRGEFDECRALVNAAYAAAKGDDRALAISHTVLAMLAAVDSDPSGNSSHYVRALEHAERAGDLLQSIRIRVNRSSHHISEGDYELGLKELDIALELADRAGFAVFRALALNNRGEALLHLGRLDEAIGELEASRALYQKLDSKRVAQPLSVLGEVYRQRGDRAMARACFEEAIAIAEDTRDMQSLVPSLAGLARVLAVEEPERAAELAELARQAVAYGPVLGQSGALVALGWVTLHAGNKVEAASTAEEAAALSRKRRDRAGLADALELYAEASGAAVLHEVLNIRSELSDQLGEARAELMLAQRTPGAEGRELAIRAHQRFLAAGATRYAAAALATSDQTGPAAVRVECLGGFRVLRDGKAIQLGEWPSKKARDLLKILVARRCRPVARLQLLDFLWPDQDEAVASPRLSVALSTVRSVLDPEKKYAADHFIGADRATIWLDGDQTTVDVELFLHDAREGLNAGDLRQLRTAEAAYSGDFLEEDVYADWAAGMREEARALYVRVARVLAERGRRDPDAVAGYLLRILQRDQYDERAHLGLVTAFQASGAHGEARRAYRTYVQRMGELEVEPAPFPARV
ncbi:tetratricopeptide repeat protein [Kribbella sandramycini]|uniref:ATP/maltotriose-dependent transcriptional regulator MalT n=1 Tax=Kribbella sandramycini TaxID=60450 RepID=A0A7Y4NX76_9ACTN|nr:ATP/maltotriose-dependent transcriptional regulator MalT [Kribbella sandramycini]NOL39587.1 tetratricopeptide repeat protein [Kribbella sandramycini]